jgi:hypothetical protein
MRSPTYHSRLFALLPALALAAYGVVGVFGHSLHGLLPCADGDCGAAIAIADAGEHHACCCHHHAAPQAASESDEPQYRSAGHDADNCSLCLLLVQIKSGHSALFAADVSVAHSIPLPTAHERCNAADTLFAQTARGPPAC